MSNIKDLDRICSVSAADWNWDIQRGCYLATFTIYGDSGPKVDDPREGHVAILEGLRLMDAQKHLNDHVTLEHIVFNHRLIASPPTSSMRFNESGELRMVLADFKNKPLLVPGAVAEATFCGSDPSLELKIKPIFTAISNADALRWYAEHGSAKGLGWHLESK